MKYGDKSQILILKLLLGSNTQQYGVDVSHIQEILSSQNINKLPQSDPRFLGVIKIRDEVLPLMDLKQILTDQPLDLSKEYIIVVCNISGKKVSFAVDAVETIEDYSSSELKSSESISSISKTIIGFLEKNQKIVSLLDMDVILGGENIDIELEPALEN